MTLVKMDSVSQTGTSTYHQSISPTRPRESGATSFRYLSAASGDWHSSQLSGGCKTVNITPYISCQVSKEEGRGAGG